MDSTPSYPQGFTSGICHPTQQHSAKQREAGWWRPCGTCLSASHSSRSGSEGCGWSPTLLQHLQNGAMGKQVAWACQCWRGALREGDVNRSMGSLHEPGAHLGEETGGLHGCTTWHRSLLASKYHVSAHNPG